MKLNAAAIEELSATSAYKAFEQHCCILQKVEPRGLSINERVLFWCNIYNTITGEKDLCSVCVANRRRRLRCVGVFI
jgi:hypothetical protein